jgi:hypothetical protein
VDGGPGSYQAERTYTWPDFTTPTSVDYLGGLCFARSLITPAQVDRGTAHVILIGEKAMDPDHYTDGFDPGDNETMYVGQDNDMFRCAYALPQQDISGQDPTNIFGSAHAAGCNFVAGDGSVHLVTYDCDLAIFQAYGVRTSGVQGSLWDE